jgi:hypothetical protein
MKAGRLSRIGIIDGMYKRNDLIGKLFSHFGEIESKTKKIKAMLKTDLVVDS